MSLSQRGLSQPRQLVAQLLAQLDEAESDTGLDRAERGAEPRGDLRMREIVVEGQLNRLTLCRRQGGERGTHTGRLFAEPDLLFRIGAVSGLCRLLSFGAQVRLMLRRAASR